MLVAGLESGRNEIYQNGFFIELIGEELAGALNQVRSSGHQPSLVEDGFLEVEKMSYSRLTF